MSPCRVPPACAISPTFPEADPSPPTVLKRLTQRFPVLVLIAPLLLSACSEMLPGLNIRTGGAGAHQYSIVADRDRGGYEVAKSSALPSYHVVPVDAEVLRAVASRPQGFDYDLPTVLPSDVPPEYRLGPGDIVYVTVWDHPELTTPTLPMNDLAAISSNLPSQAQYIQGRLVASDGSLYFPYVGTFKAAGMTAADLRSHLSERLQSVIAKPQLDVRVVGFRAARVEVTGEVAKPGTINLDDMPKGIIQAINLCGGLSGGASRRRAILVRQNKTYTLDLAGLISGSRPVSNPVLMPGDVLHIPDQSEDQVFVLGGVDKQQPVAMQQASVTLIQALTTSGGLDFSRGKQSGVIVFRMDPKAAQPDATVFTIDLGRPDGLLLASRFELRPRDVVYVPTTALSQYNSIINQLLPTVSTIFYLNQLTK